jgi:hypothetical protein
MISQLLNPKNNKQFRDQLIASETAYKVTIGDNYKQAKDLGMTDANAFTYANVMSMAEGVSESIMPDIKFFDTVAGSSIKEAFKGNLKNAATKEAAKTVTKDFFKNIGSELGEEEFTLAVEDGLKYSMLLNHKNSEFFNLSRQKELAASTVIMSGALGGVAIPNKLKESKKDIYTGVYNNIADIQDIFATEIKSPLTDKKTKETLYEAYKFASDVANAVAKAPETVTADQIDLLVQKNKLEEKKKNIDTAFHPEINKEIADIDAKIAEMSKAKEVTAEVTTPVVGGADTNVKTRGLEPNGGADTNVDRFETYSGNKFEITLTNVDENGDPLPRGEGKKKVMIKTISPDGTVRVQDLLTKTFETAAEAKEYANKFIAKDTTTEVNTKQPVVTAETSSNFANMTQDGEGNFVFYHVSPTTLDVIDPSKYGSNAGNVTSKDEKAAIGRVGGVAMFYTDPTDSENMVNGNKHVVKVPESEVYDFNSDPENFIDEAKRQFSEANPNMAFSPNDQFAWITKVAGDNGYKMVVGEWGKGKTRAQTTQKLTPVDVMELNGNVVTKPFEKEYVGNREKGFKSVVPQSKQSKIEEANAAINSFRSRAGIYDELYQAVNFSRPNMTNEEINKLVNESDIPQELKDQHNEAMAYEPGKRRTEAPAAAYERTDDVSLDNAPEGTYLNIGLNIGTTQDLMDKDDVISMLPEGVEVLDQGVNEAISEIDGKENKELTLSVKLSRPLTDVEMAKFLVDTKQKAIPQMSESKGAMHGTKEWGDFNPEYFYMPDGSKLSDTASLTKNVDAELEALNKLFDESEQGGKVTDKQIENGKKAIEGIVPGVEWVIHDTNESMREATGSVNNGEYIMTTDKDGNVKKVIHINKAAADGTTVAHEVFHAVLIEKVLNDADAQELTRRMMKAVAKTASPKLKIQLDEFAATYDDPNVRDEERLAQLIGILAQNYDQLSQPNKNIVKKWLDKLAKMFGLKPFTDNEVIDLLNTIAGKTAKGEAITEKDVNILGDGKINVNKTVTRQSKFIDSLVFNRFPTNKNTKVLENFDLASIDGQVAASTLSDKLTAGELKKYKTVGGKQVLEAVYTFFGGIGYPEVTGRVWAASSEKDVKKIIDVMKVSSDGYRYLIPAVMSNVSHMSNKNMTSITMEVFKEAINNKELNRDTFKKVILKAFDKKEVKRFKEGAIKAISGNISAIDMADKLRDYVISSKMTFESRRGLLEGMVGNSDAGNPKFSTVGTFLSLAKSLTDPIAKDAELYQVPVVIRTKGNLTPVKTDKGDKFYHESYGYHIESDQEIEVLHLDGIYNLTDIIPEFTKDDGTTVSTEKELKEKGSKGWDIKRILTNLGRTHGLSKYSAKIVSKKPQVTVTKRSQKSIGDYVRIAKANNFSDDAIKKFLKSKGFSDTDIDAAMSARTTSTGRPSVNDIYDKSKKAIEDRKRKMSIKDLGPFLRKSILDRQAYIKRLINKIDNKSAKKAYDLLVTKAGASALASERFKRAEKKIYGGLNSKEVTMLDKIIYAKRMVAVNESRAKLGMEPYKGMDGYSLEDAKQDLADFKSLLGDNKFNDLNNRATAYFDVFKLNLKKLYDSGRISKETYDSLKDTEYSPIKTIKYIIGDNLSVDEIDTQAKSLGISRKDIMKLSDSNENEIIMDSKWLLAMNISSVEGRAFENNMLREFDRAINAATPEEKKAFEEFVLDNPVVGTKKDGGLKYKYDDTKLPPGFVKVSYFNDGNKVDIIIKDEYAKQLLDVKNNNKSLEKLGALTGTKILRFFATGGNPLFIIGNTAVDFQNIAFFSNVYSKFKPMATVQLARDYTKNFVKKLVVSKEYNKIFNEYINHGGALDYMASDGLRALESMNPIKGVTKAAQRGLIAYGRAMAFLGETSEVAFRLSVFEKVKNDSIKEFEKENNRNPNAQELDDIMWKAARESRETMDFSQGGDVAKNIDAVFPYFNAALQGIRRPIDFAKKDPVGFSASVLQYTVMASSLAAGAFAMLIKAVRDDEDDDKKANKKIMEALNSLSEYEKANYHIIFTGNKNKDGEYEYYRVKKLPVLSVISTVAEQLIYKQFFNSQGVDYDVDSEAMLEAVSKSNPLPVTVQEVAAKNPVASGLVSYWANKDTFTGDKIFREPNNKKISPEAEGMFDDKVDQIYKDLAPGFGLSPARTKVMVEKVITSANTNPTIPLMYSAYDGLFNNNDGLGAEVQDAMSNVGEAFGKKLVRHTDKNVIRYKEQDKMELQETVMETDVWKSEQKVYNEIKNIYKDGDKLSTKELVEIVKENFEPMDHKKYFKKYNAYIHNMSIDKSVLDIIFEDVPEVQAMKLNQRYGDNLEGEELKELYKAMNSAGKRVNKKSIYIYNQKYKNRKD